ncbi:magnesium chelatase domain-containing protein, partial [Patescibacteria group bacterium]
GAGSVQQIRFITEELLKIAKSQNISVILIGHVTKEGVVAGPRTLEHLVDVVLYLEGERYGSNRILRGIKNRFGSTGEIGIFEMRGTGLRIIDNASLVGIEGVDSEQTGTALFVTMEGKRAMAGAVQALVTKSNFGFPKRTASGLNLNRLQLLVAVLTKKAGLDLDDQDVYVKVAGGMKVDDPAVDLAVSLAVASSYLEKSFRKNIAALGEIGLSGEIRIPHMFRERLKEAEKLGFKGMVVAQKEELSKVKSELQIIQATTINDAIAKSLK